jgi:predicted peroxiredoxin
MNLPAPPSSPDPAGIAILLWASEPEAPHRLVTPFFHAAAAAALDVPVEIYFTARSVLLLRPGVAAALRGSERVGKTVLDAIREAVQHGAVLLACTDALHAQGMEHEALIPECTRRGGAVQFMARVSEPAWRTLVF